MGVEDVDATKTELLRIRGPFKARCCKGYLINTGISAHAGSTVGKVIQFIFIMVIQFYSNNNKQFSHTFHLLPLPHAS